MLPVPGPRQFVTPGEHEELNDARRDVAALHEEVAALQRRVEKQAVLLRALFALLHERVGITEAELLARFSQVEAIKASSPPRRCRKCGRGVNVRHHRCLYCEEAYEVESAFEFLDLGPWPGLHVESIMREGEAADNQRITTRRAGG